MIYDNLFNGLIQCIYVVTLDNGGEIFHELIFQSVGSLEALPRRLLAALLVDRHDELDVAGLDEHRDGIDPSRLKPLDRVSGDVEDAVFALLRYRLHAAHARPVEVVVVLPGLDELVVLRGQAKGILEGDQILHFYIFH